MPDNPTKVLIVASGESSREPAYLVTEKLRPNGYSCDLCHSFPDDVHIKADRNLNGDIYLPDYKGVLFMDDGGDHKSSLKLAKASMKEGIVVGGFGDGCLIMHKAGLLKDAFVCTGLPKEFYSGATQVNSPSARSGNVVTATGGCASGFAMLVLDALGGKVNKVIQSETDIAPLKRAKDVLDELGILQKASVFNKGRSLSVQSGADKDFVMVRTAAGWEDAMASEESDSLMAARSACVALQSELSSPGAVSVVSVRVAEFGGVPKVKDMAIVEKTSPEWALRGDEAMLDDPRYADKVETELSKLGIWLQPDGGVAVEQPYGIHQMATVEAMHMLWTEAVASFHRKSASPGRRSSDECRRDWRRLRILHEMHLIESRDRELHKTAATGYGMGGPNIMDGLLPTDDERVHLLNLTDDLIDEDKTIEDLPRYDQKEAPGATGSEEGDMQRWIDPANAPYSWFDRGTESDYKQRVMF